MVHALVFMGVSIMKVSPDLKLPVLALRGSRDPYTVGVVSEMAV